MDKQKLNIQTREEFDKEIYKSWNWREEQKAIQKGRLESDINSLKSELERKKEELQTIKPLSYKAYRGQNTYEDWVRKVRKDNTDYDIIENKDSKEVV